MARKSVTSGCFAALILMALSSSSGWAAQRAAPAGVLAPIYAVLSAAQSGDLKRVREQYAPSITIMDEFAPFMWSGANALTAYFASYGRMAKETKMTDSKVSARQPKFAYVAGTRAYVLVPITVTAKVGGKPYTETGSLAFTLQETHAGWKIATQTWVKDTETFSPY
jgi:ketosteroid isomerase-like protein